MEPKIVSADTGKMPQTLFGDMPVVTASFDNGEKIELFSYYPDEISFSPSEFIGLTEEEGRHLKFIKDKRYLQS